MTLEDEKQRWLSIIAEDIFDTTTRLVFSDWLEEHGLDDEATEQRRCTTPEWCCSARWLQDFASKCGQHCTNYNEYYISASRIYRRDYPSSYSYGVAATPDEQLVEAVYVDITYETVMEAARAYVKSGKDNDDIFDRDMFTVEGSERARGMMNDENIRKLFWQHYEIVTGSVLTPQDRNGNIFSCSC